MAAIAAFALTSCGDDNDGDTTQPEDTVLSGSLTSDRTLTKDNIYTLSGRYIVEGGATLTIEAGTIIKAEQGTGASASALIVSRDGMINAQGTATEPIIFTSVADQITQGQIVSPNLTPSTNGLWGGVIILGEAPISAQNANGDDVVELQIEGIPTTVNALYGGTNGGDNSGTFSYVSIRHGGANIGDGNEINGLTMGGVGSGTTVNNIEIVANQDDGIEWFGGNVSVNNVVIWNAGDDALDTDQDWIGTCSDFIIVTPDGSAFELDGPEGSTNRGTHQFDNGVVYAGSAISDLVDWDDNTNAGLTNIYFYGIDASYTDGISSFGGDGAATTSAWEYTLPAGLSVDSVFQGVPASILTEVAENANTVGPDASAFGWTWAGASNSLSAIGL